MERGRLPNVVESWVLEVDEDLVEGFEESEKPFMAIFGGAAFEGDILWEVTLWWSGEIEILVSFEEFLGALQSRL